MLNRHLSEFGIAPALAYPLGLILFTILSFLLFFKTEYAAYIYIFFAISFISNLGERNRTDFLKYCFPRKIFQQLRVAENLILSLPFLAFLLYQQNWQLALVLLLSAIVLAFINFNRQLNFTIPTPFYKYPFEFTVGFRKTFLIPFFAYFLCFMAISVDNFNLGLFSLLLIFLVSFGYYTEPEAKYYSWIFAYSPQQFIWSKLKIALASITILTLPISLSLCFFFLQQAHIVIAIQALACVYLIAIVLAKYVVFPKKINLAQVILLSICIAFPPFLLGLIPFFYSKSIQNLKAILA